MIPGNAAGIATPKDIPVCYRGTKQTRRLRKKTAVCYAQNKHYRRERSIGKVLCCHVDWSSRTSHPCRCTHLPLQRPTTIQGPFQKLLQHLTCAFPRIISERMEPHAPPQPPNRKSQLCPKIPQVGVVNNSTPTPIPVTHHGSFHGIVATLKAQYAGHWGVNMQWR